MNWFRAVAVRAQDDLTRSDPDWTERPGESADRARLRGFIGQR